MMPSTPIKYQYRTMARSRSHAGTSRNQKRHISAWIVALTLLLWPAFASAQGTIMPTPHQVFLTNAGAPLSNGKICTYVAGSVNTALATYSDEALTTELPNPIRTNSAGRPQNGSGTETNVYWAAASYKVVVMTAGSDATCSTGTTIYTADHVPSIPALASALDVTGTAGETLVAGDAVYLSASDGEWYRADADATATSTTAGTVGVVPANIANGGTGSIRLQGRITGLSALSTGDKYYLSATAGAITNTPPTNARYIAQADSTTSIVVGGNPSLCLPDSNGTHDLCIKTTSDLTADRLLTFVPGDAARTVTIAGDTTISQNYSTTGTPAFSTVGVADSDATHFVRLTGGSNLTADRAWTVTFGDAALTTNFTPGTAGTVLRSDGTNWAGSTTVFPNSATTGDVLYASAANTYANLTAGTSGLFLQANGAGVAPTWAAVAQKVVQIITATYSTAAASSSSTFADTGLTASITPTSASNKVLVLVDQGGLFKDTGDTGCDVTLQRAGGDILAFARQAGYTATTGTGDVGSAGAVYLDAPATTSATTYKTQFASFTNVARCVVQHGSSISTIALIEVTP